MRLPTSVKVSISDDNASWSSARKLASYQYAESNGLRTRMTYGNGHYVDYSHDLLDRLNNTVYSSSKTIQHTYADAGGTDSTKAYTYTYDTAGNLVSAYDGTTTHTYNCIASAVNKATVQTATGCNGNPATANNLTSSALPAQHAMMIQKNRERQASYLPFIIEP